MKVHAKMLAMREHVTQAPHGMAQQGIAMGEKHQVVQTATSRSSRKDTRTQEHKDKTKTKEKHVQGIVLEPTL